MKSTFFIFIIVCPFFFSFFLITDPAWASRTIQVTTPEKDTIGNYKDNYALLIGVSDYTSGWPDLEQIPNELKQVETLLIKLGFKVVKNINPDAKTMKSAFENFIDHYGYTPENRLLFFFSGHGHTMDNGRKGFLVSADAPDPRLDPIGFRRKALDMNQILSWCRQMDVHHALFLFDSCFSGTVFKQKNLSEIPLHITRLTARPVRQFITAGSAGESVPSLSVFTPAFVDAIEHGLGDLNQDGYISGTELGLHLQRVVSMHTSQTPQYGKIKDYDLSRGDFIFKKQQPTTTGSLDITSTPANARIYLDGVYKGVSPLLLPNIPSGNHLINARFEGLPPQEIKTNIQENHQTMIDFQLNPEEKKFTLHVIPNPIEAQVQIINVPIPYYKGISLTPGRYNIKVSHPGYITNQRWINVKSTENIDLHIHLSPEKNKKHREWTEPETGIKFVWIPNGCFSMGSPTGHMDEIPPHEVCVDGFWMGKYEITNGQYRHYNPQHNNKFYNGKNLSNNNQPVSYVSWQDTQKFIRWLNKKTGHIFDLPTEAQWEYACRAETTTSAFWGNQPEQACIYANISNTPPPATSWDKTTKQTCDDGFTVTSDIGSFQANNYGIYDMLGNVWEWCQDTYAEDAYTHHASQNPIYINDVGTFKVFRGGAFNSPASDVRCADRDGGPLDHRYFNLGFRVIRKD